MKDDAHLKIECLKLAAQLLDQNGWPEALELEGGVPMPSLALMDLAHRFYAMATEPDERAL